MRSLAMAVVLLAGSASRASAAAISVYGDPAGLTCPQALPGVPTTWFVLATTATEACGGISGAEFRLDGFPTTADSWFLIATPADGTHIDGDPFGDGVRLAGPDCRSSEQGVVLLLTLTVVPFSAVSDQQVHVAAHRTPSDPQFSCPVLRLCNAPEFSAICAQGGYTRINALSFCPCQFACGPGPCPPLAVERQTWSAVVMGLPTSPSARHPHAPTGPGEPDLFALHSRRQMCRLRCRRTSGPCSRAIA
jgi:hypothetical protein